MKIFIKHASIILQLKILGVRCTPRVILNSVINAWETRMKTDENGGKTAEKRRKNGGKTAEKRRENGENTR